MLVSKAKLKSYQKGSLEEKIESRHRRIRKWEKCENVCTHLIVGNFDDHSIVMDETGKTFKLFFEDGDIAESQQILGPKVYDNPKDYFQEEADRMVARMKKGLRIDSSAMANMILEQEPSDVDLPIIEKLQELIKGNNLWNKFYNDKIVEITNLNWSNFEALDRRNHFHATESKALMSRCDRLQARLLRLKGVRSLNESVDFMLISIEENLGSINHHLTQLSDQATLGEVAHDLIECIKQIDNLVTYAECVRLQEA